MTTTHPPGPTTHHVTFHARVASVGLITTMVVLVMACLTFMMQQWAVAGAQSTQTYQSLGQITAETAAPALRARDPRGMQAPVLALHANKDVVSARLVDAEGTAVATYQQPGAAPKPQSVEIIRTPVIEGGQTIGQLTLTVRVPELAPMLPKFIALTGALFFAGVGVALFLARGMAHRVIAPVERLSEAMHSVAASGSFEPVDVQADDQLFRSLTDSFNHLLLKLGEREQDLKRAMQELVEARDAANAANVLKTQFLANMSHEIRTPLNGVLAMAEVMAMGDLAQVQRERLEVIRQSGGLLLSVLNDVLDLSKIEAGKLTILVDDFELQRTIQPTVAGFEAMAQAKGLDFALSIAPEAQGWWRGDADRIRQIVGNLLSNAVKFTPNGSVSAAFDISPETGALRLVVKDTGIGITASKLPALFEKFTQADNTATRRFGGTGLGLAICRELTQMMGGSIRVESREGEGAVFSVELPLARGEAVATEIQEAAAQSDEGSIRLLAAEDNPTNQQVLTAVMDSLGIDVDVVANGELAVEAWRGGGYDLILMDIQMPVMDGIAAARAIRAEERAQGAGRIPIVALTANALSHQVEEYLAAGMDGHVAKPIEIAKLYEAISRALNEAAAGRASNAA